MIRASRPGLYEACRYWISLFTSAALISLVAGCAIPPKTPSAPSAEEVARQQRLARAQTNLSDALKKYDSGNYDDAINNFLVALDSGQLTGPEQLNARKHMAFIHCLSGREANCKEEFEKIIAFDPKFGLSPAEAGHPIWGPIYRLARTEIDLRRSGRTLPLATEKPMSAGEKLIQEATTIYDNADYNRAIKIFQDALKESLSTANQIAVHKFIAFSYCLTNRMTLCRTEFESILKLDANFDLAPAESGHPSWGPSFRAVKGKQKSTQPKS